MYSLDQRPPREAETKWYHWILLLALVLAGSGLIIVLYEGLHALAVEHLSFRTLVWIDKFIMPMRLDEI